MKFYILEILLCVIIWNICPNTAIGADVHAYVSTQKSTGMYVLAESGEAAPLVISSMDFPGVIRVAKHLQTDIAGVTDAMPILLTDTIPDTKRIVLIGTLGKSPLIDKLVREKKIDSLPISGKWEASLIQIVDNPLPHVDRALVLCGSDKRGTIYAMYDLSAAIGVSPWYWWADVPVKKNPAIYISPGTYVFGEPAVKYRGIFINDEAPALSGWAYEKFDGFNHKFYEHVFELILRLKGNFLWPAMWGRAFYVDDTLNPKLADEYGIVVGTSHHEPMMRAHAEWAQFGSGPWNYAENETKLREFWREGIRRMDNYESIVTLAMRGDGDEPMSEEANIALLQRIVKDQRNIIREVTGKKITDVPQVWALYKEVQEYYDRGMRVPDDVTLLLCDDNWGNIRKLPQRNEKPRSGGYGIYYHYDYVGGPRNYKWLNTNQIERVWEQMHLAYEYGADRIWIVNVGDIKPMEYPIDFFLDYTWDPQKWPAERLPEYTREWAAEQFGSEYAAEIAHILSTYTRYNSRRKPELLAPDTYSLINYREAEKVVEEYNKLTKQAERIFKLMPAEYKDAYYQLVLHPVLACSNLNELYVTTGKNRLYAQQGRSATNELAEKVHKLFSRDAEITYYYHNKLADGKWNHMMSQTHIGYTYWQQPEKKSMPEVEKIELSVPADMGVSIEGSPSWWPMDRGDAVLPEIDPFCRERSYIEIFNRGKTPFNFSTQKNESWLNLSTQQGEVKKEIRVWISVDWDTAPKGKHNIPITIEGPRDKKVVIRAIVNNPSITDVELKDCFIESNGYVSIEAEHFSRAVNTSSVFWQRIPGLGRTLSAMTPFPVTAEPQLPTTDSAHLEYQMYLFNSGEVRVKVYLSPTLNYHNNQGLRYAISFNDETPQIINMHAGQTFQDWEESVRTNIIIKTSTHTINTPGRHVLKYWAVDPGVVMQKLVIETATIPASYLGPPESAIIQ